MNQKLTTTDHNRDIAGLKYVYPVISRRAGGLSVGINFNINNACNWRCVYCQVPDLVKGAAPEMDFVLLEQELRFFLNSVLTGDFYHKFDVPLAQRVIKDIAISGNGEPTSLKGFDQAVSLIAKIATELGIFAKSKFVLITNGSLMHKQAVQTGLKILNNYQGQVWFKLDSATVYGRKQLNDCPQTVEQVLKKLKLSSNLCETHLQTCMLEYIGTDKTESEQDAYLDLVGKLRQQQIGIKKVMLYTVARPSLQPEAEALNKMSEAKMTCFAEKLKVLGYEVSVSP
ncbi:MAG: radical SAM protein [Methylococcales bacterium]|nr:radical SAM protein [Methylococcales bacterium]